MPASEEGESRSNRAVVNDGAHVHIGERYVGGHLRAALLSSVSVCGRVVALLFPTVLMKCGRTPHVGTLTCQRACFKQARHFRV